MLTEQAIKWLASRGISEGNALAAGLEVVSGRTGDELVFPYRRGGQVVNRKYRALDEKRFRQDAGGEKIVWNFDAIRAEGSSGPVICVEGEMDALAAMEAGFARVVSVPDGAPAKAQGDDYDGSKYDYLPSLIDAIRDDNEIILAFDADAPGRNLLNDISARIGRARVRYVREYPKGCKDLNDALKAFGVAGVVKTLERAQWWQVTGVCLIDELPPERELVLWKAGLSPEFDAHVSFCPGHFSAVTGLPGSGKSAAMKACAINISRRYGVKPCVASFEDDIRGDYLPDVAKYLAKRTRSELEPGDWERAEKFLKDRFVFIAPQWDESPTVSWLIERMEVAARRHGCKLFVIDPWTEIEHEFGNLSETQYTREAIGHFRRFARRFDVHVCMICHPAKPANQGADFIPGGYAISGSAHFVNKAELGFTVHKQDDHALIRVWKSKRHDIMGRPGDVKLTFDYRTGVYGDYYAPEAHQ
jgi:twinkle protein